MPDATSCERPFRLEDDPQVHADILDLGEQWRDERAAELAAVARDEGVDLKLRNWGLDSRAR
jgi:hypothetical protein